MQYQSSACQYSQISCEYTKPFEKAFMDTMKLFMAIPRSYKLPPIGQIWLFLRTDLS